jgi:hypothetical protein
VEGRATSDDTDLPVVVDATDAVAPGAPLVYEEIAGQHRSLGAPGQRRGCGAGLRPRCAHNPPHISLVNRITGVTMGAARLSCRVRARHRPLDPHHLDPARIPTRGEALLGYADGRDQIGPRHPSCAGAQILQVPESRIRVNIARDVGGGFG